MNLGKAVVFRSRSTTSLAGSMEVRQAFIDRSGNPIRFFDPRRDIWEERFKLNGPVIQPITPVGEVTARVLRLNASERVIERQLWQALGQHRRD
jgi:hypothetical protein